MAKAYCTAKPVNTEEHFMKEKNMTLVEKSLKMEIFIKANITWIATMELANTFGIMELFTKVILLMIKCLEREFGYPRMEMSMKVNFTKEKGKAMADIPK